MTFRTLQEIKALEEERRAKMVAWDLEEARLDGIRKEDLKAREEAESLYKPHLDEVCPIALSVWMNLAGALGYTDVQSQRFTDRVHLTAKAENSTRGIVVEVQKWGGLSVSPIRGETNRDSLREYIAVLATKTKRTVELYEDHGRLSQVAEPRQ